MVYCRVAGVGRLSGTAAESLTAFGERVFANFRDKNVVFYNCGKTGHLWLSKDLHTHRHVRSNTLFDVEICTLVMYWLYESSPKVGSPKALRKLSESCPKSLQKLSESSLKTLRKLSESSTKAGSAKALRKLSKSSPKALQKLSESSPKAL